MTKRLVAYFSATGITKTLAQNLCEAIEADIFEIIPTTPYTSADLNWMDKNSRSTIEMKDSTSRPSILNKIENMNDYDTILIGFPIWWYVAPTIINTFLESYDFSGKIIILFATSGGSKFGKTLEKLSVSCPNATLIEGGVLNSKMSKNDIVYWFDKFR